eukprot:15440180-Alexandrium_andersonii.AAC.1
MSSPPLSLHSAFFSAVGGGSRGRHRTQHAEPAPWGLRSRVGWRVPLCVCVCMCSFRVGLSLEQDTTRLTISGKS